MAPEPSVTTRRIALPPGGGHKSCVTGRPARSSGAPVEAASRLVPFDYRARRRHRLRDTMGNLTSQSRARAETLRQVPAPFVSAAQESAIPIDLSPLPSGSQVFLETCFGTKEVCRRRRRNLVPFLLRRRWKLKIREHLRAKSFDNHCRLRLRNAPRRPAAICAPPVANKRRKCATGGQEAPPCRRKSLALIAAPPVG